MTWTASGQVANILASSPHARTLILADGSYATVDELTGVFLHTQPDTDPMFICARSTTVLQAKHGYFLSAPTDSVATPGAPTSVLFYTIEGVRSDGAYTMELRLRKHVK